MMRIQCQTKRIQHCGGLTAGRINPSPVFFTHTKSQLMPEGFLGICTAKGKHFRCKSSAAGIPQSARVHEIATAVAGGKDLLPYSIHPLQQGNLMTARSSLNGAGHTCRSSANNHNPHGSRSPSCQQTSKEPPARQCSHASCRWQCLMNDYDYFPSVSST